MSDRSAKGNLSFLHPTLSPARIIFVSERCYFGDAGLLTLSSIRSKVSTMRAEYWLSASRKTDFVSIGAYNECTSSQLASG